MSSPQLGHRRGTAFGWEEFNAHAANKMLQQERQKSEGLTRELAQAREQQNCD